MASSFMAASEGPLLCHTTFADIAGTVGFTAGIRHKGFLSSIAVRIVVVMFFPVGLRSGGPAVSVLSLTDSSPLKYALVPNPAPWR